MPLRLCCPLSGKIPSSKQDYWVNFVKPLPMAMPMKAHVSTLRRLKLNPTQMRTSQVCHTAQVTSLHRPLLSASAYRWSGIRQPYLPLETTPLSSAMKFSYQNQARSSPPDLGQPLVSRRHKRFRERSRVNLALTATSPVCRFRQGIASSKKTGLTACPIQRASQPAR